MSNLNNKGRNIQETESFEPVEQLPPRPIGRVRHLKELLRRDIHEPVRENHPFPVTLHLQLLIAAAAGPQASGEGVVLVENNGERALEAAEADGAAEQEDVFDGESEEVLVVQIGEVE